MNEQIKEVENLLKGYWAEVYQDNSKYPSCVLCVEVDGDWKHDHLAVKHILTENGYNQIREEVIGDSDSDSYRSIHLVMKASKEFIDGLFKIFAA